jgi:hypothetical protein
MATGEAAPSSKSLDLGTYPIYAMSSDGGQIALFNYPKSGTPEGGELQLINTKSLKAETVEGVEFKSMINTMSYSPDGNRLVATYIVNETDSPDSPISEFRVALIDLAKGAITGDIPLDFSPNQLSWSSDGATLAVYGVRYGSAEQTTAEVPEVALLDGADLHTLWSAKVEGVKDGSYQDKDAPKDAFYASIMWTPAVAFSADASKLYIVHADEDKLTTVDFVNRSISTVDVAVKMSFLDRLMGFGAEVAHAKVVKGTMLNGDLSADGKQMYVIGTHMDYTVVKSNEVEFNNTSLGLRVIDVGTGALLRTIETPANQLWLSADGGRIFLSRYDDDGIPSTQILDSQTFEAIATVPDYEVFPPLLDLDGGHKGLPAMRWGFSGGVTIAVIDAETFEPLASWETKESPSWLLVHR